MPDETEKKPCLRHSGNLPPEVLNLIARGWREVLERQRVEKEKADALEQARQDLANVILTPIKSLVKTLVPEGLLQFVNWKAESLLDRSPRTVGRHQPDLCVPGCQAVQIPIEIKWRDDCEHVVVSVHQYRGYRTEVWDADNLRPWDSGFHFESLAEALAIARDAWLKADEHAQNQPKEE